MRAIDQFGSAAEPVVRLVGEADWLRRVGVESDRREGYARVRASHEALGPDVPERVEGVRVLVDRRGLARRLHG